MIIQSHKLKNPKGLTSVSSSQSISHNPIAVIVHLKLHLDPDPFHFAA